MNLDLISTRERAKYRNDVKFRAGLEMLERAEAAVIAGHIKGYRVIYCEDDPAIVHTVLLDGAEKEKKA